MNQTKKAWMTGEVFAGWMRRIDKQMRLQNRHTLLFLDNCGALPPNTTSRLQPMDAGIIQNMKMVYRKKLLRHILFLMNEASTASDIVKKVTVLDAILSLTTAWNSVSPETIHKCFRKCGYSDAIVDASSDDECDEEDLRPLLPLSTSLRDSDCSRIRKLPVNFVSEPAQCQSSFFNGGSVVSCRANVENSARKLSEERWRLSNWSEGEKLFKLSLLHVNEVSSLVRG